MVDDDVDVHIRRIDEAVLDIQSHFNHPKRGLPLPAGTGKKESRLHHRWVIARSEVDASFNDIDRACAMWAETCRALDTEVPDANLQAELLLA